MNYRFNIAVGCFFRFNTPKMQKYGVFFCGGRSKKKKKIFKHYLSCSQIIFSFIFSYCIFCHLLLKSSLFSIHNFILWNNIEFWFSLESSKNQDINFRILFQNNKLFSNHNHGNRGLSSHSTFNHFGNFIFFFSHLLIFLKAFTFRYPESKK